jgi:glycine/D-amino acid oxidase-like deaminating enzyme
VTGFDIAGGRVRGVKTSRGTIASDRLVTSVAGHSTTLGQLRRLAASDHDHGIAGDCDWN